MPDIERCGVPVELRLELCPVVSLQDEDTEWEPLSNLVQKLDCLALVADIVDFQYPDARTVINGSELVEPFDRPRDALEELHVHLQTVARLDLLVSKHDARRLADAVERGIQILGDADKKTAQELVRLGRDGGLRVRLG